ncbi:MAG: hypothetical protein K8U03_06730 [Planctomycetia bacterium]|nr:hypothetical protein [Planctomycetia bacterium]
MSLPLVVRGLAWERLGRLRDVLELLAAVRDLDAPLDSPEQFRKLIALVVRLGGLFGIDDAWVERLNTILTDDDLVQVVLAIVHYVLHRTSRDAGDRAILTQSIDRQSYIDWLPIVVELIRIVRQIRGAL